MMQPATASLNPWCCGNGTRGVGLHRPVSYMLCSRSPSTPFPLPTTVRGRGKLGTRAFLHWTSFLRSDATAEISSDDHDPEKVAMMGVSSLHKWTQHFQIQTTRPTINISASLTTPTTCLAKARPLPTACCSSSWTVTHDRS